MERDLRVLQQMQAMPLKAKVATTKSRIMEWVSHFGLDGVYVSFSGGKDSTVLLHIAREMFPEIKAVFCDTGLEYPEIREFVKTFDNVDWLKPKMTFKQVIEKYGYPFISKEVSEKAMYARKYLVKLLDGQNAPTDRQTDIPYAFAIADFLGIERRNKKNQEIISRIKMGNIPNELLDEIFKSDGNAPMKAKCLFGTVPHKEKGQITNETSTMYDYSRHKYLINAPFNVSNQCCDVMKKEPMNRYAKETGRRPITAQMASESRLRTQKWVQNGCNGFDMKMPISNPMSFWTEQDVLLYIRMNNIRICSVYGDVVTEDEESGQMTWADYGMDLSELFENDLPYLKTTGCSRTGCMFCGYGCHLEKKGEGRFERMKETHPKQYDYIMRPKEQGGLNYKEVIDWLNEHGDLNIRY